MNARYHTVPRFSINGVHAMSETAAPEKSKKKNTAATTPAAAEAVALAAPAYPIRADVPLPPSKRRGGRNGGTCKYPFDDLPAPVDGACASFAVFDRSAKQMQSTVYSAMKRHAKLDDTGKVAERVRDFKAFDINPDTDPEGAICRVFRTK